MDTSTISPWQLGATLYCPATRKDLFDVIAQKKIPHLQSLVICLEDAIAEAQVEAAVLAVIQLCSQLAQTSTTPDRARPLLFIRPRNIEMASRLIPLLPEGVITGVVLPKFSLSTLPLWWNVLESTTLQVMPTLECSAVFDQQAMAVLAQRLETHPIRERIIALRIGGNDLLSVLALRRPKDLTIYDTPLGYVIKMLVATFAPKGFSLTAPVCEQINAPSLLAKELALDKAHGLVGKTAIHPSQIDVIQNEFKVSQTEQDEAKSILLATEAVFQFKGAMCEPATHRRWAKAIESRTQLYGGI